MNDIAKDANTMDASWKLYDAERMANERLRQQLAEKDAEIERLEDEVGYQSQWKTEFRQQKEYAEKQLSAVQAREWKLRDQVRLVCGPVMDAFTDGQRWNDYQEIIDQTLDTSALSAMIAKAGEVMRERCADKCTDPYHTPDGFGITEADRRCSEIIRALPGVTLEDLE